MNQQFSYNQGYQQGFVQTPQGFVQTPQGFVQTPQGFVQYPQGFVQSAAFLTGSNLSIPTLSAAQQQFYPVQNYTGAAAAAAAAVAPSPVLVPTPTIKLENSGKLWAPSEDRKLDEEVRAGINLRQIAKEHGRTEKACHSRILLLASKLVESGMAKEPAANLMKVSVDVLDYFILKDKKRVQKKEASGTAAIVTSTQVEELLRHNNQILNALLNQVTILTNLLADREKNK